MATKLEIECEGIRKQINTALSVPAGINKSVLVPIEDLVKIENELEKYKIAIKYFQDNGKQETKDIIKNLLSY